MQGYVEAQKIDAQINKLLADWPINVDTAAECNRFLYLPGLYSASRWPVPQLKYLTMQVWQSVQFV